MRANVGMRGCKAHPLMTGVRRRAEPPAILDPEGLDLPVDEVAEAALLPDDDDRFAHLRGKEHEREVHLREPGR